MEFEDLVKVEIPVNGREVMILASRCDELAIQDLSKFDRMKRLLCQALKWVDRCRVFGSEKVYQSIIDFLKTLSPELVPCRNCGSKAVMVIDRTDDKTSYGVRCSNSDCCNSVKRYVSSSDAAMAWNEGFKSRDLIESFF